MSEDKHTIQSLPLPDFINRDKASENMAGDAGLLIMCIDAFVASNASVPSTLRDAIKNQDTDQAKKLLHRLKGSLLSLGDEPLSDCAILAEQALENNDWDACTRIPEMLEDHLQQFQNKGS